MIIYCDDESFAAKVLKSTTPVLVFFTAEWCGPCKVIAPRLHKLADLYIARFELCIVDVDISQNIVAQYSIRAMPTVILFKDGNIMTRIEGVDIEKIESILAANL
ncbi:thioredoxin family protein [Pseudomonas sp. NPDC088885]|uniref:thioredoxin family protein n=1 Tax=Pseudomonas sp. NPDC088885 TaxID=3364457 RepID=UPI0037F56AC2